MDRPRVAILTAPGINRHNDTTAACEMAGLNWSFVHVNKCHTLSAFQALILPGGFSYGDAIRAGKILAIELEVNGAISQFPGIVLGICNGFQALIRLGLFGNVALTINKNKKFECRWITMIPNRNALSNITQKLPHSIYCPVAHAEGRFIGNIAPEQVLFRYSGVDYPANPNGSQDAVAGVCDITGRILGIMPHPENNIYNWQHPNRSGMDVFMGMKRLLEEEK